METINHECYVSFEVAKLLKQAGFDWEADTYYQHGILRDGWCSNKNKECMITCSAPTLAVAQKWFREEHGISVQAHNTLEPSYAESWITKWFYDIVFIEYDDERSIDCTLETNRYNTYEEALEAGIKKALEIILEKGE